MEKNYSDLLQLLNLTPHESSSQTLHALFENQVHRTPELIALKCGEEYFTYKQLSQRSDLMAQDLIARGIDSTKKVAIYLNRSVDSIIAMIAVVKSGACYVPIDATYPIDRVTYIIEDSAVALLITHESLKIETAVSKIYLNHTYYYAITESYTEHNLPLRAAENDLAYIIYTSGSTGRPKGVMIEHGNVATYLSAAKKIYQIDQNDRVYQGFSHAFDAAIEEIWVTLTSGATLFVATENIVKSAHDVAEFIAKNEISVFSTIPTFLSMIEDSLDSVRLIITGGESLPPRLVELWSTPSRQLFNTYGPTETSVVATWSECVPHVHVTIGKPLDGYTAFVCNELGEQVASEEAGELWIGGDAVGRGYLNRPELTEEKFVANPFGEGRLYKSGDLVRINSEGNIEFLGRIDDQVKIRGHRVELSEIEEVFLEHEEIRAASVAVSVVDGVQKIAAYVVAHTGVAELNREKLISDVRGKLPTYMIPTFLEILEELPVLPSGKTNKKALPEPKELFINLDREIVAPETEIEAKLCAVTCELFQHETVSTADHFFNDLGCHSLLAAKFVTVLRQKFDREDISIRDIYQSPNIQLLAEYLKNHTNHVHSSKHDSVRSTKETIESVSPFEQNLVILLQTLSIVLLFAVGAVPTAAIIMLITGMFQQTVDLKIGLTILGTVAICAYPLWLMTTILLKWIIIGKYKAGEYPVGGFYYFRFWLVSHIQAISGSAILKGSPLMNVYFRLMGATVGKNSIISTEVCSAFDLVTIGENSAIGADSHISGMRVESGLLKLGTVTIGDNCFVGIHSSVGLNATMESGSALDDGSMLYDDRTIPTGVSMKGSPAQACDLNLPKGSGSVNRFKRGFVSVLHVFAIYGEGLFLLATSIPSLALILFGITKWGIPGLFAMIIPSSALAVISFCLGMVIMKKLIVGKISEGTYEINSIFYVRKWMFDNLMGLSRKMLLSLYATLYITPWLRMLGAKLGKRMEVSTVANIAPDLLESGGECFFADGAIIGGARVFNGVFQLKKNIVGSRTFIGNSAMLPAGSQVGSGCLIGCLSLPPFTDKPVENNTKWLGSPSFSLPRQEEVESFDEEQVYSPSRWAYTQRLVIDALRIVLPGTLFSLVYTAFYFAIIATAQNLGFGIALFLSPFYSIALAVVLVAVVALIKHVLFGEFKPVVKPLWCRYIWFNEMINGLYETVVSPIVSQFLGTPFAAVLLRWMGCKIGKKVYIGTTLFSEFDLVQIGDYACLNGGATIQTHLFEDRIMKSSYLSIAEGATVGSMSVVLYNTVMQKDSVIGPLSLLMKGENLAPNSRWYGIPSQMEE